MPGFRLNADVLLLQDLQAGTMYSPETSLLMICAPTSASLSQPAIEQVLGQGLPDALIQCCFHEPQLHVRVLVPFLFFHPIVVTLI